MAINIPNISAPGESFSRGVNTGSSLFSRMMDPVLRREAMAQQKAQQEARMAQERLNFDRQSQLANQRMALEREKASQYAALNPVRRAILMQKLDPLSDIKKYKAAENFFRGGEDNAEVSSNNGIDLNLMKKHPALQGFAKKYLGYDEPHQKSLAYHGAARDAYDLERLRNELGEDSDVYKNAKRAYESSLASRDDLSAIRGRSIGGLRPGETWKIG